MTRAELTRRRQGIDPVTVAFAISLAFHLALFTALELNYRFHWWNRTPVARWLKNSLPKPTVLSQKEAQKPKHAIEQEIALQFVDVDPALATLEAPKETKLYSALSTKASNPDVKADSNVPKIEGEQTKIIKSFDTLQAQKIPPQPAPATPTEKPEQKLAEAKSKPVTAIPPGELPTVKPESKPAPEKPRTGDDATDVKPAPPQRPKTLAQARQQKGIVVSPKMKQEGGVKKQGAVALDVKGTAFGAYDAAIVAAVQQRWYDLLEERKFAGEGIGKVILEFRLNSNGKITEMKTTQTEVGPVLAVVCQRAVLDPSPYAEWPSDMLRAVGRSYREVRFTFYY